MSIHCNPKIISNNLFTYLDAANQKSYPKFGPTIWGDMSNRENHFSMWGNLINDSLAFNFVGNNTNYFSSENFIHPTNELTIEMWLMPTADTAGSAFYCFGSEDPVGVYHYMADQSNLTIFGPNQSVQTGISILGNTWKHVVRTSLRSTGTEKIYINGVLEYSTTLSPSVMFNQVGYILLGQKFDSAGFLDSAYSYDGKMSIFKLYNKVLNEDEVKQNFIALKGRFNI